MKARMPWLKSWGGFATDNCPVGIIQNRSTGVARPGVSQVPDAIRTRCTRLGATQELLDIEEVEGPSLGLDNLLDEGPKSFEGMMVTFAMIEYLLPMFSKKSCSFSVGVGLIVVVKDGLEADGTT